MKNNIGKLFFKDYYQNIDFNYVLEENRTQEQNKQRVRDKNETILASEWELINNPLSPLDHRFKARILYPGIITGTGLVHDSKKLEGAFNLGMHFDYTYGMPVIYGSSVKGVLRSYFNDFFQGNIDTEDLIRDIFAGEVRDIEKEMETYGNTDLKRDTKKRIYQHKSNYKRDIFFDAVITEPYKNRHILATDSITPHGENPLKNPIPITMLKIAPGCSMEFRFKLVDSMITGEKYSAENKLKLFKEILTTVGVGAKTNVGYGQLKVI